MSTFWDQMSSVFSERLDWFKNSSTTVQTTIGVCTSFVLTYSLYRIRTKNYIRKIDSGAKAVVITGASSGMGLVTALYLCDEIGFKVFACVRRHEDGDKIMKMVRFPARMQILILDVTKQETIDEAVSTVTNNLGNDGLYGLFNNAGTTNGDGLPLEFLKAEHFTSLFDVNTLGAWRVTNGFLPLLRKAKGTVVNNTSVAGFLAFAFSQPYSCTKFALESMSDTLRREVQASGVRVVVLQPALINSSIFKHVTNSNVKPFAKELRQYYPSSLLRYLPKYMKHYNLKSLKIAQSAEIIACTVDKAFRGSRPKTRYCVGGGARMLKTIARLSDEKQDWLLSKFDRTDEEFSVDELDFSPSTELRESFPKDPFFEKYNYHQQ